MTACIYFSDTKCFIIRSSLQAFLDDDDDDHDDDSDDDDDDDDHDDSVGDDDADSTMLEWMLPPEKQSINLKRWRFIFYLNNFLQSDSSDDFYSHLKAVLGPRNPGVRLAGALRGGVLFFASSLESGALVRLNFRSGFRSMPSKSLATEWLRSCLGWPGDRTFAKSSNYRNNK